jgi:hypothetical protein
LPSSMVSPEMPTTAPALLMSKTPTLWLPLTAMSAAPGPVMVRLSVMVTVIRSHDGLVSKVMVSPDCALAAA